MSNKRKDLFGTNIPDEFLSRPSPGRRDDEPEIDSVENLKLMAKIGAVAVGAIFLVSAALKSYIPEKQAQNPPVSKNQGVADPQPTQSTEHDLRP